MSDSHRSGRSTGRVSCKSTELNRCSMIEMRCCYKPCMLKTGWSISLFFWWLPYYYYLLWNSYSSTYKHTRKCLRQIPKQMTHSQSKKIIMIKDKVTRKHCLIVCKIYQFIQPPGRSLLDIRKSMMMTSSKMLLWHRHLIRYKITTSPIKHCTSPVSIAAAAASSLLHMY